MDIGICVASHIGDLDYVYMTSDTSSPLLFRYVDLSAEQSFGQHHGRKAEPGLPQKRPP